MTDTCPCNSSAENLQRALNNTLLYCRSPRHSATPAVTYTCNINAISPFPCDIYQPSQRGRQTLTRRRSLSYTLTFEYSTIQTVNNRMGCEIKAKPTFFSCGRAAAAPRSGTRWRCAGWCQEIIGTDRAALLPIIF